MNQTTISAPAGSSERLPLGSLLALAMAAFITLLTEIMPAGVLSSIAGDLKVSESRRGSSSPPMRWGRWSPPFRSPH